MARTSIDEVKLLEYIRNIPPDQNPYFSVIDYVEEASKPPSLPKWAQSLLKVIMVFYVLMWFQCFYLIYVRLKTKTFRLITITRLGLWRFDVPNISCITYFIYPPLVLADLALQQRIDEGKHDLTDKIPLLSCKFLVVMTAAWDVEGTTRSSWSDGSGRRGHRVQLPRWLVLLMNFLFVSIMVWFTPCLIYLMTRSNNEYKQIRTILKQVLSSLTVLAKDYVPETYEESSLILALIPARQILVHEANMAHYLRSGLYMGLASLCVLSVVYAPLLKSSIDGIRQRTKECTFALSTTRQSDYHRLEQLNYMQHRVKQEYWTLLIHGLGVYLTALAFIPVLAWQASVIGTSFMRNQGWLTVTQLGMHGPFAISGNVIELMLNLQAKRLLQTHKFQTSTSNHRDGPSNVSCTTTHVLQLECSSTDSISAAVGCDSSH